MVAVTNNGSALGIKMGFYCNTFATGTSKLNLGTDAEMFDLDNTSKIPRPSALALAAILDIS